MQSVKAKRGGSTGLMIAFLAFQFLADLACAQQTRRVRKDGTGDFTTIQACVNAMSAGDTCLIGPGTYQERVKFPTGKSGSASAFTTVKAETPGTVETWGVDTANCNYLRIEGLNIAVPTSLTGWTDGVGIAVRSSNLQIISNYIHDVHYAAISGTGNNNVVRGNRSFKCGMGVVMSGNNWLVEQNTIERTTKYPEIGDADHMRFFGMNHVIRGNRFFGTLSTEIGSAHVDAFQTFDDGGDITQHIIVENNIVEGFYHQGFMLEATFHSNNSDIVIRNNIFVAPQTYAVAAFRNMRDVKVYNNVVINPNIFGVRIAENSTGEVRNNIFYSNKTGIPDGDIKELTYSADTTSTVVGDHNLLYIPSKTIAQSTYPNDIVNQNPMFVNLAGGNYHLNSGSPAVDRGVAITGFNYDIEGLTRPQGLAWDIGPYEFASGGVSDTNPPTVSLTAPANGAVVSNSVTLTATAADAGGSGVASVSFLVDGAVIGTATSSPYSFTWDSRSVTNGSHTLRARAQDAAGNQTTSGAVTIQVQNATLTLLDGLMGNWPMHNFTGNIAVDSSGNGNNGTLMNGAIWGAGRIGSGLTLDGTDDYLRVLSSASIESVTNAVTVCAWVNLTSNGSLQSIARKVLNENTNLAPYAAYDLVAMDSSGTFRPRMGVTRTDNTRATALGVTHAYGSWFHLVGVYDGAMIRIFVNGVEEGNAAFTGNVLQTGQPLCIGRYGAVTEPVKGAIDEFRLYNRALSAVEIQSLYNATAPLPLSNLRAAGE